MAKKRQRTQNPSFHNKEAAPNLFERLSNKKRFDVLGRKAKGDIRNVSRLRTAATEKRKSTLLVEYKQLRKSNAFIDRRFGEDDESLTADEKAILRFQKQRLKELAGSKFALPDDAEEGGEQEEPLTHLGRALADINDVGPGWGSDEEEDGGLGDAMVRDFHFGGGLFEKKAPREEEEGEEGEEPPGKKSKKEVMEEIIAKSKQAKAQKAQQKEEDVLETERLDSALKELMGGPALAGMMRKKGVKISNKAENDDDRRFDVMTRELVFEAKAQPGDRTLGAEELAEQERVRLERLEAQRLKRMQGGGAEDEDDFEDEEGEGFAVEGAAGGYAARRARRAERAAKRAKHEKESGDVMEDDFDSDSEGEEAGEEGEGESEGDEEEGEGGGMSALDQRRRERAAGSHPLQGSFREASSRLLAKYGVEEEQEGEEEEGESEKDELESEREGEEEGDSESEDKEEEGRMEGEESEEGEEGSEEEQEQHAKASKTTAKEAATAGAAGESLQGRQQPEGSAAAELPFTPALPQSYQAFVEMAQGLSAADLGELVHRIRAYNSSSLTTEHRKKLQLLYGVLVQHFATLAGQVPLSLVHLDALLPHLIDITQQVPFYAATLARARLQRTQQRMAQALKSDDAVQRAAAWPSPRALLLLRLWATVFPTTDKRHPVLTPASLLVTSALALSPLARPHHVALGLFLASMAVHMHSQARRFVPEPLSFAVSLLETVLPTPGYSIAGAQQAQQLDAGDEPRWLCIPGEGANLASLPASVDVIQPLQLPRVLGLATACSSSGASAFSSAAAAAAAEEGEAYFISPEFKTSAAAAAARLVERCAEVFANMAPLPEIMAPAQKVLRRILAAGAELAAAQQAHQQQGGKAGKRDGSKQAKQRQRQEKDLGSGGAGFVIAPALLELCREVLAKIDAAVEAMRSKRRPLVNPALMKTAEAKQFNPRYEENYATGKDYDPDRERSERRRLQRQLRKEERGAMRELRKDATFMAGVRDKEKAVKQAELDQSARRAISFLQNQEADFKSGGQGGMWKKGKKGRK